MRKIVSVLIAIVFLCQSTVFGTSEKTSHLRPPSHFSKTTQEFIKINHEAGDGNAVSWEIKVLTGRLVRGSFSDSEISVLPAETLYGMLTNSDMIDLGKYDLQQKMLVYSAAPGSGKDDIMRLAFKGDKKDNSGKKILAPYEEFTEKLILYHTRRFRKGEKDGIAYHFGNNDVGDPEKNRLLAQEEKNNIKTAYINKQLQGVALEGFEEELEIPDNDEHRSVLPGDKVIEEGRESTIVRRKIKGLKDVFEIPNFLLP